MKAEKIIWGLILVFIGGILLLQNFEVIDFYWQVIFRFWPLVLIIIGANLLFSKDDSRTGGIVAVLLTVLALGFIAYKGITTSGTDDSHWSYNFDEDEQADTVRERNNTFSEVYTDDIERAVLNISGGATQYVLDDTASTSSLFEADVKRNFGNYSLLSTRKDSSQVLNFKMAGKSKWNLKRDNSNEAKLRLNTRPVWDINIEMGAGTTDFDLSPFKVNNVHVKGGAASFDIKVGMPVDTTTVSIETGVSDINISIPTSAACKINTETGLSSNDFEGFVKQSDGSYTTPGFEKATKIIIINFEGGLSNFEVKRY